MREYYLPVTHPPNATQVSSDNPPPLGNVLPPKSYEISPVRFIFYLRSVFLLYFLCV